LFIGVAGVGGGGGDDGAHCVDDVATLSDYPTDICMGDFEPK